METAVDNILNLRDEVLVTRQELLKVRQELQETNQELGKTKKELSNVSLRVVPVGSTYIEYHNQPSPHALWPDLTWIDISTSFAGQFFRVAGGSSAPFGAVQNQCAPRITRVGFSSVSSWPNPIDVPTSGWSNYVYSGSFTDGDKNYGVRFWTEDCEVRPQNQAIKIWQRIA